MTTADPLVCLWQNTSRALNWRAWLGLTPDAAAQLRYRLLQDLQDIEGWDPPQHWAWVHTHRQILELKAMNGHEMLENSL